MSIESRLAAKKRAQEARKKATLKKLAPVIVIAVIAVIVGAVFGIKAIIKYNKNHVDFTKYLNEDGTIRGYAAKDCVKNLPDLSTIPVDHASAPTEEEIRSMKVEVTEYLLSLAGETVAEDATDDETLAKLTDELVANNGVGLMSSEYEYTVAGLEAYLTKYLTDNAASQVQSDVYSYVINRATVEKLPKKYIRFLGKKGLRFLTRQDYLSQGYTDADIDQSILDTYGTETAFRDYLEGEAESDVKSTMIMLAVYDELGLNITMDDFKKAKREEDYPTLSDEEFEKTWKSIEEAYPMSYLFMQYKCQVALEELAKKNAANYKGEEQ